MSAKPAFHTEFVVTSSDKWIDVWDSVGLDQSVSMSESTYESMQSFIGILQTLLRTLGGVYSDIDITIDSSGKVRFDVGAGDTFIIKFGTGAHAASNMASLLGYTSADTSDAQTHTGNYQHQHGWYADQGVKDDTKDREIMLGSPTFLTMSGKGFRTTWNSGYNQVREVELQLIAPEKFFSDEAATNEAFQDWWLEAAAGSYFHYFTDSADLAGTDQGKYILDEPADSDLLRGVKRESPGDEYYNGVRLRMRAQ